MRTIHKNITEELTQCLFLFPLHRHAEAGQSLCWVGWGLSALTRTKLVEDRGLYYSGQQQTQELNPPFSFNFNATNTY